MSDRYKVVYEYVDVYEWLFAWFPGIPLELQSFVREYTDTNDVIDKFGELLRTQGYWAPVCPLHQGGLSVPLCEMPNKTLHCKICEADFEWDGYEHSDHIVRIP